MLSEQSSGDIYRGTANLTVSGYGCLSWDNTTIPSDLFTPANFPSSDLEANYCRNPGGLRSSPWCFTNNPLVLWELCPICSAQVPTTAPASISTFSQQQSASKSATPTSSASATYVPTTPASTITTSSTQTGMYECTRRDFISPFALGCFSQEDPFGAQYRGSDGVTESGYQCLPWGSPSISSSLFTPANFPTSGLQGSVCRNPGGLRTSPWCYTTNPNVEWELCNVCSTIPATTTILPSSSVSSFASLTSLSLIQSKTSSSSLPPSFTSQYKQSSSFGRISSSKSSGLSSNIKPTSSSYLKSTSSVKPTSTFSSLIPN